MEKNSVYSGEVVGYTVGKIFKGTLQIINVQFETLDDAQGHCDTFDNYDTIAVYFPIKLQALSNSHVEEPSYD